jgi:hypothetical protein
MRPLLFSASCLAHHRSNIPSEVVHEILNHGHLEFSITNLDSTSFTPSNTHVPPNAPWHTSLIRTNIEDHQNHVGKLIWF